MEHDTAGDPITGLKWTRKTTEKIAAELTNSGIKVSANTVGRLLRQMGYSLRVNHKKIESGIKNPPPPEKRNRQFECISALRKQFASEGNPVISIDSKKKEHIGNFKNKGTAWEREPISVKDHDFPSDADGRAVPYGIWDEQNNAGYVYVGISSDTPAFAVDCIDRWWSSHGSERYPEARRLLILADSGGSNASRSRVFKYRLYHFCQKHQLTVTVCHYPPGSSKWNPIEHRLFSEISKNWAGKPLCSYETMLNYIRTTRTSTGLTVQAELVGKTYEKGERISDRQMKSVMLDRDAEMPDWTYTIRQADTCVSTLLLPAAAQPATRTDAKKRTPKKRIRKGIADAKRKCEVILA